LEGAKEKDMKAIYKSRILAESNETIIIEGNHYFPSESVNRAYLKESKTSTICPWKGQASYYHIVIDGDIHEDAAWYYSEPKEAAKGIKNYVAFSKGIEVLE
jgi:uncharacterized protein (DUF427 family)